MFLFKNFCITLFMFYLYAFIHIFLIIRKYAQKMCSFNHTPSYLKSELGKWSPKNHDHGRPT
jgi:hypothetical protein